MLEDLKTAIEWIAKLLPAIGKEQNSWQEEENEIDNELHCRSLELARLFVQPDVLSENPIDHTDSAKTPAFRYLKKFLEPKPSGHTHLIILADAGMGKTSLLAMIKLLARKRSIPFYSSSQRYKALKLGPNTLDRLSSLSEQSRTVLLLDALDEDPLARGQAFNDRLAQVVEKTSDYLRVIITCRTQFFPATSEWGPRSIQVGNFFPKVIHLSPFTYAQVRQFLRKRFPDPFWSKLFLYSNHKATFSNIIVEQMKDLRARPLLLSYIEFLADSHSWSGYGIYKEVLQQWFALENRKRKDRKESEIPQNLFWESARLLAVDLFSNDVESISPERMKVLIDQGAENLRRIDSIRLEDVQGRSIMTKDSRGAFRFAHRSFVEFLVADYCLEIGRFPFEKDRLTDEIVSFFDDVGKKLDANLCLVSRYH